MVNVQTNPMMLEFDGRHAYAGESNKITVEVLFNPLIGLDRGHPPHLRSNDKDARPPRGGPVMTIGQLLNPLLELEQRQERHPIVSFEALNDVVVASTSSSYLSSSSSNRRNRFINNHQQIELSSIDKLVTESNSSSSSSSSNNTHQLTKRRVRFSDVKNVVHWIPSHREYNPVERDSMWSNPAEIEYNACRNRVEFRYEGYNWRHVLDETKFVLCSDGRLYHPITVELFLRQLKREQRQREQQRENDEAIRMIVRKRKRKVEVVVASSSPTTWILKIEEAGTTKRQRLLPSLALLQ